MLPIHFFSKISIDYNRYENFLNTIKKVLKDTILVQTKSNHIDWMQGESTFSLIEDTQLNIQYSVNSNKMGFQLISKQFDDRACFRFDSHGPAHNNGKIPGLPLQKLQITTPHFQKVHTCGYEIAFKSDKLLQENEKNAILSDINLALAHFCHECNIRSISNKYPTTVEIQTKFIKMTDDDPLKGINF